MQPESPARTAPPGARRLPWLELGIVLALSLGQSAVYSVVDLVDKLTRGPLGAQTTTMNPPLSDRRYFDLTYQLLDIAFDLAPVALVFLLFALGGRNGFRAMGFDLRRPGRDAAWGLLLFAAIGVGTLGVYAAGRAAGVTTAIVPAALDPYWWTVPVLMLSAARHAVLEETIVVGFLRDRLAAAGWGTAAFIAASALLRGSYHLYQGFGPFLGNVAMGVVFAWFHVRTGRVMPLVVAHALLDAAGFVGYALFGPAIGIGG